MSCCIVLHHIIFNLIVLFIELLIDMPSGMLVYIFLQVVGEGVAPMTAEVLSVSDRQGVATVLLRNGSEKYSERVQDIPLVRLRIQDNQVHWQV